ncbi:MAG: protein TonB [Chitinophagales bacterium]|jgi:protein TonB
MLQLAGILLLIVVGLAVAGYAIAYYLLSGGKSTDQIVSKYQGSEESKSVFVKKYAEADLSKVRTVLLAFGAIVAFSSSIYALSWADKPQIIETLVMETIDDELEIEAPQTEQVKPPPPPPPPPEIQVVEDDEILEDEPEIEDIEIEEDEIIEVPDVIEPEEAPKEQEIFTIVEDMPKFKGCEGLSGNEATNCTNTEIQKFIAKNIVYPPMALENDIEGKVFIRFVVNQKGEVTDVSIAKGADSLLDNAASKLVKTMPKFTPGKQRGKAVPVQYIIPINFKIG